MFSSREMKKEKRPGGKEDRMVENKHRHLVRLTDREYWHVHYIAQRSAYILVVNQGIDNQK